MVWCIIVVVLGVVGCACIAMSGGHGLGPLGWGEDD